MSFFTRLSTTLSCRSIGAYSSVITSLYWRYYKPSTMRLLTFENAHTNRLNIVNKSSVDNVMVVVIVASNSRFLLLIMTNR